MLLSQILKKILYSVGYVVTGINSRSNSKEIQSSIVICTGTDLKPQNVIAGAKTLQGLEPKGSQLLAS